MKRWLLRKAMLWFNRWFRRRQLDNLIAEVNWVRREDGENWLRVEAEHPNFKFLTQIIVDLYQANDATNFMEWSCVDPVKMEGYTLTIRPASRPTPSEVCMHLRMALQQIAADQTLAKAVAINALARVGYPTAPVGAVK